MKDETYLFISDSREKKAVARSAAKRVTHGGTVRFPSDYMTKKELNAMNGEVISYPMNDPLTWKEFKALPDDIKVLYIKALRESYNAPNKNVAEMMGVHPVTFQRYLKALGLCEGQVKGEFKKEEFYAWAHRVPVQKEAEKECAEETIPQSAAPTAPFTQGSLGAVEKAKAIPLRGEMTFSGKADEALETVRTILGGAEATITVSWITLSEAVFEDG